MVQKNENKILLHACCGICSGHPIFLLKELGYEPVVYFCNPNLDTKEEFNRRLEAQRTVCDFHKVKLVVEEYNHDEYLLFVSGLENEPEKGRRCDKCIELRLRQAFNKAKELGISTFTTSLVISPHKNFARITEIGKSVSGDSFTSLHPSSANLPQKDLPQENLPPGYLPPKYLPPKYLPLDFKKKDGFLKTNKLSRELRIYRQNYCGCEFSRRAD